MSRTVLFAGGGTGGHIYPNVAIVERLRERASALTPAFLVSERPGDAAILGKLGLPMHTSCVQPLPSVRKPWRALPFLLAWRRAVAQAVALLQRERVVAVVATGGFVSGPALVAARKLGLPRAMVNLDAIPGKANAHLRRECSVVFSAYVTAAVQAALPGARHVGFPLRRVSLGSGSREDACTRLGLDPARPLLFVTGATHGAESIVRALMAFVAAPARAQALSRWQVLHQCGSFDVATLQRAYDDAGVRAKVVAFCDRMGDAWHAAALAVSRAGAGSVAEAWANAAPTVFLPNPYHADGHQRANVEPLLEAGGAIVVEDRIDPQANLDGLGGTLQRLLGDDAERERLRAALQASRLPDGATTIADWLAETADASAA
ncbi:MAG: glycosyltransferase [Nannocystaceae bacterium]|nr:glycosyltransferase [Nannocystaceae bacterium]